MKKADLLIAHSQGVYNIKVDGRANFECAPPLRNLSSNLEKNFQKISIDLTGCTGMDSTFMGVLAMLGLQVRAQGAVEIVNASIDNQHLLQGLGIHDLFNFVTRDTPLATPAEASQFVAAEPTTNAIEKAETVLTAHDTLIKANEDNRQKFEKVVEFAQKDLDKLKAEEQQKADDEHRNGR